MYLIGIDVGGTNTKFGLIKDNELIKTLKVSTNTFDVVRQLVNGAKELVQNSGCTMEDIAGIAVGFPGMVIDSQIKDSPNIGLQNCNILDILNNEFEGRPVVVMNDAELAVLAEHKLGAGKDCDNMILITIGTGVGGGLIIDKQLYVGKGGAGELGHIVINKEGIPCNCGRKGCVEQYISLRALDRMTRELYNGYPDTNINISSGMVNAKDLVEAYKRNDDLAIVVIDKYVEIFKDYILNICNLLRPDKIVIGGGLSYAPEIIEMIAKACKKENFGFSNSPSVDIVPASLGNDAGIMGAVVCFEDIPSEDTQVDLAKINSLLSGKVNNEDTANQSNNPIEATLESSSSTEFTSNNILEEMINYSEQPEETVTYDQNMLDRLNERLNHNK